MTYDKINNYFNWHPAHSLEDGIKKTILWYTDFLKKHDYKLFLSKELK